MIGFSINADSNIGYSSPTYQQWTEGEMWLGQAALGIAGGVPGTKLFTPDYLGGITKGFSKLKDILLEQVGGINNWFFVGIYGTPFVFIEMDPTLPANVIANQFIERVQNNRAPLADQVMFHVCKRIVAFDEYLSLNGDGGAKAPILSLTVNL